MHSKHVCDVSSSIFGEASYSEHSGSGDDAPVLFAGEHRDGAGGEAGLLDGTALAGHVLGRHRFVGVENCIAVSFHFGPILYSRGHTLLVDLRGERWVVGICDAAAR